MRWRENDKLQTVTDKEELTVGGGQSGGRPINKHETAWWRGGPAIRQTGEM